MDETLNPDENEDPVHPDKKVSWGLPEETAGDALKVNTAQP
jgi:hypothetical protein